MPEHVNVVKENSTKNVVRVALIVRVSVKLYGLWIGTPLLTFLYYLLKIETSPPCDASALLLLSSLLFLVWAEHKFTLMDTLYF